MRIGVSVKNMKAISMLLIAIILWGTAIAPTKWALEFIQPFTLLFLRLSLAALICVCFTFTDLKNSIIHKNIPWKRVSLLSFTGVSGYFMFTSVGIALTSGLHVSIIDAGLPLVTIVFSALFLKEKIHINYWIGIVLGIIGVLCITIPDGNSNGETSLLGDILILLSTFLFAFYTVLLKRPKEEKNLSNQVFTTVTLLIGAIMLIPFASAEVLYNGFPQIETGKVWLSFLYLVIGATILAYWFWNKALESISASVSGLYLNALPLVSMITSIALLNESLTWRVAIGGSFVLFGVLWADQDKWKAVLQSVNKGKESQLYK